MRFFASPQARTIVECKCPFFCPFGKVPRRFFIRRHRRKTDVNWIMPKKFLTAFFSAPGKLLGGELMRTKHSARRKKKVQLPVVFITTAIVVLVWSVLPASADPVYVPQGPFATPAAGPVLPGPTEVPGKEFSSHSDRDHFHIGDRFCREPLDREQ